MVENSIYRVALNRNVTPSIHQGFDYKGQILKRTMSPAMFTSNKTLYDYLMRLDDIIYEMFNNTKRIKSFYSWGRDKFDRSFN